MPLSTTLLACHPSSEFSSSLKLQILQIAVTICMRQVHCTLRGSGSESAAPFIPVFPWRGLWGSPGDALQAPSQLPSEEDCSAPCHLPLTGGTAYEGRCGRLAKRAPQCPCRDFLNSQKTPCIHFSYCFPGRIDLAWINLC